MSSNEENLAKWRGQIKEITESLSNNQDELENRIKSLRDNIENIRMSHSEYKVHSERRISKLESKINTYKWIIGLVIGILGTVLAMIVRIAFL